MVSPKDCSCVELNGRVFDSMHDYYEICESCIAMFDLMEANDISHIEFCGDDCSDLDES